MSQHHASYNIDDVVDGEQYALPAPQRELVLERVRLPKLAGREVRIKVCRAGICHSDLHLVDGYYDVGGDKQLKFVTRSGYAYPMVPGKVIFR